MLLLMGLGGCGGYMQGNLALARGDYRQAEQLFQEILVQNPEDATARRRLAMTYFYMGRDLDPSYYARSVQEFRRIGEIRDPTPEEQFHHGFALIGEGRRAEGFGLLKNFSYPRQFRTQQFVRERAAQLESDPDLTPIEIFTQMERAWKEGEQEDLRERLDERHDPWDIGG
ncbi:Tetratricopeptide repeat-containing protein [Desulfonatronum thiosulfatophilum]|uniref:Tetratricopeptide repeat-containing protein n=1 Tax=Desulfonatronum thiosulfatophilum TaxID=617002 RepID=A0A1G6EI93_9BACT|nr:tetratricopeptide repeat protein [Desulfonatronum thiosulfatophilum]SDB57070.1 Tetratricopeptide repeat-containing protein [Desulfonatronum thiosulfatophilum]